VQIATAPPLHLTYCTNIHPADGWDQVLASLRRYGPPLKARLSPDAPFGLGLRLSARDARELLAGEHLIELQRFLDAEGLYVAIINGFPYGTFHNTVVKAEVYAPDWRDPARLAYTEDLARILAALLPDGLDGGVSTAPLSYKAWVAQDRGALPAMAAGVAGVAATMARLRETHGAFIHLDIEPEPDCVLETSAETIAFFNEHLLPAGVPVVAEALGIGRSAAEEVLRQHVQVCFDCCHFAVEFEDPGAALARFDAAGIRIGRVQLSSAVDVTLPAGPPAFHDASRRLRPFADPVYLHQVVERPAAAHAPLARYPDLGDALDRGATDQDRQWRIHFHVPLFTHDYEGLGSTQRYVADVLALAASRRFTTHLEIETYTWDVLPGSLKIDLLDSIEREYQWVLKTLEGSNGAKGS
jgi:sugar phosphate isomerase/epimerase